MLYFSLLWDRSPKCFIRLLLLQLLSQTSSDILEATLLPQREGLPLWLVSLQWLNPKSLISLNRWWQLFTIQRGFLLYQMWMRRYSAIYLCIHPFHYCFNLLVPASSLQSRANKSTWMKPTGCQTDGRVAGTTGWPQCVTPHATTSPLFSSCTRKNPRFAEDAAACQQPAASLGDIWIIKLGTRLFVSRKWLQAQFN